MVGTRRNFQDVMVRVPHEAFVPSPRVGLANEVVDMSVFREEMIREQHVRAIFNEALDGTS